MMSDDIAHNDENPTPGIIINQPGGKDVYHGVPKDYTGDEVSFIDTMVDFDTFDTLINFDTFPILTSQ